MIGEARDIRRDQLDQVNVDNPRDCDHICRDCNHVWRTAWDDDDNVLFSSETNCPECDSTAVESLRDAQRRAERLADGPEWDDE